MRTWLSDLEEFHKTAREMVEFESGISHMETPGERMARVLRELVMGVKQARVCFELLRDARQIKSTTFDEWFENMSSDAEDLIFSVR